VPPDAGLQTEKSHFSTLNVGLAGTGNRTQATCLAGSVTRRSAIHYAFPLRFFNLAQFIFQDITKTNLCGTFGTPGMIQLYFIAFKKIGLNQKRFSLSWRIYLAV
jgi:hypothetical protein